MKKNPEGYMTTPGERQSYWTYFVGQNIYYAITAAFISTYLAMQGIDLTKVAAVLLKEEMSKFKKTLTTAVTAANTAIIGLGTAAINSYSEFEQLAGGAKKIFDQMDYSRIEQDAQNAYKTMNISASEYIATMNDVGATFAATMGDEAGYNAAKTGLQAIADYASGTGKNVDVLSEKFTMMNVASYARLWFRTFGMMLFCQRYPQPIFICM